MNPMRTTACCIGLLVAGADAHARDAEGRTALTRVKNTRHGDARRRQQVAAMLEQAMGW